MQFFTLGANNKLTGPSKEIKDDGLKDRINIQNNNNNIKLKYNAFMPKFVLIV